MKWRAHKLLLAVPLAIAGIGCIVENKHYPLIPAPDSAAAERDKPAPLEPKVAPASPEGAQALAQFQIPAPLRGQLFAAEPMLANPVAFFVDNQGKVYVCETFRQKQGVEDNRSHGEWLDDDLAAQSIDDRLAYMTRHLGDEAVQFTQQDDRIRLLEDTDGDGKADKSTVFADRFNGLLEGTGAGVLAHNGAVYYTCIPNLWRLKDTDGDGQADDRESLHYGFGVRFAFRGHDMHGLTVGPDGRLYFSIGDRGYNVVTPDGRLADPESGAVFRCEFDGSKLEVVATGLRNPQELAFDDYGNLFTGDNNSDSGDLARFVYVVEGGDSGWRMAYQYLADRGPFNREKIWHPFHPGQPAYIVPPIDNIADGPAGLAYYPGTGLTDDFEQRFLLCDFRGGAAKSGVRSFRVKPNGAFFDLVDREEPFWNMLATDVAFGPDGAVYISDWVHGWDGLGKGRIYRFFDPAKADDAATRGVAQLLNDGMAERTPRELQELLAHADQRIRLAAQLALASAGHVNELIEVAQSSDNLFARLHAIWGLGQVARSRSPDASSEVTSALEHLLKDSQDEVRAQAAKVAGEIVSQHFVPQLIELLEDRSLRVRYFAALGLGIARSPQAIDPLLAMIAKNRDKDPILRHGGVMGLAGINDTARLRQAFNNPSDSVRLAIVVALRRLKDPAVSHFLNDRVEEIVAEAARAIHDVPIREGMPQLAAMISQPLASESLIRRVLNANFRNGDAASAKAVAGYAAQDDAPEEMRLEALSMLATWHQPSNRDRVLGMWRPLAARDREIAINALRGTLPLIVTTPGPVRIEGAKTAAHLGIVEVVPTMRDLLTDTSQTGETRADALLALASLKADGLKDDVAAAVGGADARLRAAALNVLTTIDPPAALQSLETAVYDGELVERQQALATLAKWEYPGTEDAIARAVDKLVTGTIPLDTQLDVIQAAEQRASERINARLAKYEAALPADDPLAAYRPAMVGGTAAAGKRIFSGSSEASCVRCHKIDDVGGDVGPDLSMIAVDKTREYLLEAIVLPNRAIAKDYESVTLLTLEGKVVSGIVKQENDKSIQIMTAQGELLTVEQAEIEARRASQSAMPEDIVNQLSLAEIRDLVEYLASLKQGRNPTQDALRHE